MIFSIQRYIEDHLARRGIDDRDQYAVAIANLYDSCRAEASEDEFLARMRKTRTLLFRNNPSLDRAEFEAALLKRLDKKFQKKNDAQPSFPGGVVREARQLRKNPRTIRRLVTAFKQAIEARAVDPFWKSRKKNNLRPKPENIAQALLAVFAKGVLGTDGLVLRELASGIGFVDVQILFGKTPHLIEVKILKGALTGDVQLATYMTTEGRSEGWLVLIDARSPARKSSLPSKLSVDAGTIHVVAVDINPPVPSKIK